MNNSMDEGNSNKLRVITYLSPSIPIEFFQKIVYYLEEKLKKESYLMYESRWSGPCPDRVDPFTCDDVDIGFLCSTSFMKLLYDTKAPVELLPVAPVYSHPRSHGRPVYFSDVIIHKNNKERFKEFVNLRGCKWAYNDPHSLSGCYTTLRSLKQMGESASFFGHAIHSGTHVKSVQLVLDQTVECAAIDSNCLALLMQRNKDVAENIHILTSFGPLPVYPVAVNSRMPDKLKQDIASALREMHLDPKYGSELNKYLVSKFDEVNLDHYKMEEELRNDVSLVLLDKNVYY